MIQVVSISFQLAGAVILLLWSIRGAKRDKIIAKCFPGSNIIDRDKENNCIIEKNRIQRAAREIYLNIFAFLDVIVGYVLGYFAVIVYEPVYAAICTILITAIIIGVEMLVVKILASIFFVRDEIVPYEKLETMGVETAITQDEINALFKKTEH